MSSRLSFILLYFLLKNIYLFLCFIHLLFIWMFRFQLQYTKSSLHHGGPFVPEHRTLQLRHAGSVVAAYHLSSCSVWVQLLCSMWDLSSLTRDQSHAPCIARQTQPLDHQGSLLFIYLIALDIQLQHVNSVTAYGIQFPDQVLNPGPCIGSVKPQPLGHQGSPQD